MKACRKEDIQFPVFLNSSPDAGERSASRSGLFIIEVKQKETTHPLEKRMKGGQQICSDGCERHKNLLPLTEIEQLSASSSCPQPSHYID